MKKVLNLMAIVLGVILITVLSIAGCKPTAVSETQQETTSIEETTPEETILEGEIITEDLPYSVPQYPTKQEKEAILAARKIAKDMGGEITLKLLVSPDNVCDFEPFFPEWERETGIKLKTYTVPWPDWFKELMNVSITKTDQYDIFMLPPQWVPDLAEAKVIENLQPFIDKYKPEIFDPGSPNRILPGLELFGNYKGNYYLLLSDTDVATLYLRKDWLEDPDNKSKFESKYGYPLDKPKTLEEWRDQLEFFHNPEEERFGMVMSWGGEEVLFNFFPSFLSHKVAFFDDEMHPNINSPEAVETLNELKENLNYAMPGTLEFDFARTLEAFAGGKVYSTVLMTWAQAALEDPEFSKVVGNVTYAPFPGRLIEGEIVAPQPQYWGWGYSVSAYSKYKELSYLYCQWMSGAAMNARVALTPGGWYDVCKVSNYDESQFPEIRRKNGGIYMDEWMDNQKWQVEHCFPPLVIRGGAEYTGVLVDAVTGVLKGAQKSEQALEEVAAKWEEVTERYGREEQIESWNSLKSMYSPAVRKWLGWE